MKKLKVGERALAAKKKSTLSSWSTFSKNHSVQFLNHHSLKRPTALSVQALKRIKNKTFEGGKIIKSLFPRERILILVSSATSCAHADFLFFFWLVEDTFLTANVVNDVT